MPVTIARVTDGDTVVLNDSRRVRLIGINALEMNTNRRQDKQWALSAKVELEQFLSSQKAVSLVLGLEEFDRHGRTLAHLQLDDGSSAAEVLIRKGLALSIAVGPNHRCAYQYEQSEQLARTASVGMWQKPGNWYRKDQQLTGRERGFQIITSKVAKARESSNSIRLELNNGLRVTLDEHYLATQRDSTILANNLKNKRIEVRGWLGQGSGRQKLTLSHPTNLRVLPY